MSEPATLFHYCSNESFLSILKERQLIASALRLSNDSMEGKWIEHIFAGLCARDEQLSEHQSKLISNLEFLTDAFGSVGFCLSEEGDLLSQWRGYADNGAGVSIGFNANYLHSISLDPGRIGILRKIIYDIEEQERSLNPFLEQIKKHIADGAMRSMTGSLLIPTSEEDRKQILEASSELWKSYLLASEFIYKFKNPAFREEKEWRLIYHTLNPTIEMSLDYLRSMEFRAKHDRIIPIQKISLKDSNIPVISEVLLGPRNITPVALASAALAKYGFKEVKVSKSKASYR
jgi:hypothetical protein